MDVVGITGAVAQTGNPTAMRTEAVSSPFANVLQSAIQDASKLERQAHIAVKGLMDGSGVEVHEAMIATQKADLAFELALQVRNKVVAAYQQMMQMQF